MNIKRILSVALATVTAVSVLSFTGCELINSFLPGGDDQGNNGGAGVNGLVMEAEFIDIDEVAGAGVSNNNSGLSMIYGDGTDEQKEMWSGGYYVGYMHNDQTELEFVFNSSKASTANISLSLGSELVDITLNKDNFAILVNGEQQVGYSWFVAYSEMDTAEFNECKLTAPVNLVEGENKITIKVLSNDLGGEGVTRGPLLDYVKVTATDAELTWTPHEDNPYRRDNEV